MPWRTDGLPCPVSRTNICRSLAPLYPATHARNVKGRDQPSHGIEIIKLDGAYRIKPLSRHERCMSARWNQPAEAAAKTSKSVTLLAETVAYPSADVYVFATAHSNIWPHGDLDFTTRPWKPDQQFIWNLMDVFFYFTLVKDGEMAGLSWRGIE